MSASIIIPLVLSIVETFAPLEDPKTRKTFDDVGFCTTSEQMENVIKVAKKMEKNELSKTTQLVTKVKPIAAIAPHDDHLYAARVYLHSVPHVARAKTVVIFGVTHSAARKALGDPKDVLIFDDFESWEGPYGPVAVDKELRAHLIKKLQSKYRLVTSDGHATEHSIEAMLPFLQHESRDVRIVPIMVTEMSFSRMGQISSALGKILKTYVTENKLTLGEDVSFLVSVDAVHYGPDFGHSPFGVDEEAHEKARQRDIEIGKKLLSKTVTKSKLQQFADRVWGGKITWCGRYSVPFGLLAAQKTVKYVTGNKLVGIPLRYSDSYSLGVLPLTKIGIGTTAPFSLKHWVGYWAIVYGTPAG